MADREGVEGEGDGVDSPLTPSSPLSDPISTPSPGADPDSYMQKSSFPAPVNPSSPLAARTESSTPLGPTNAARRPNMTTQSSLSRGGLPQELQARMKEFQIGRQKLGAISNAHSTPGTPPGIPAGALSGASSRLAPGGVPANFRMPLNIHSNSSPDIPGRRGPPSLAEKRGLALPGGLPSGIPSSPVVGPTAAPPGRKKPGLTLSQMHGGQGSQSSAQEHESASSNLDKYKEYLDPKTGTLRFKGKASITNEGVVFDSGASFDISLDQVDTLDELGKGNYGTVYKVRHSRPRMRRPGLGLAGNKPPPSMSSPQSSLFSDAGSASSPSTLSSPSGTTGVIMAMKEIRLELEDTKFAAIIMELDILHKCVSPFIVDFYGAFFQEGAVYICMEFMDGGSVDKQYVDGIPEGVLRKIALSTTMGLKYLKDEHNIIHRDVKPTNILTNTRGQVKICDFGVSGNLVASIAKTNIGCQSYMAPERISSGGVPQAGANPGGGTYSVQSDIWSLGLTIIECALGRYPYPPETYDNIFSQLAAIVDGDPPDLPDEFSPAAHDFVRNCLMKIPTARPTYSKLMQHPWLAPLLQAPTIVEEDEEAAEAGADLNAKAPDIEPTTEDKEVGEWVKAALEKRRAGKGTDKGKPALHSVALDKVQSPAKEVK